MTTDQNYVTEEYHNFLLSSLQRDLDEKRTQLDQVASEIRDSMPADDVYREICSYVTYKKSPNSRATYLYLDLYESLPKIGFDNSLESFSDLISKFAFCNAVVFFAEQDLALCKKREYHYW